VHLHPVFNIACKADYAASSQCHVRCTAMYRVTCALQAHAHAPKSLRQGSWWYCYSAQQSTGCCGVAWRRTARLSIGRCPHVDSRWTLICAADVLWMPAKPSDMIVVRVKTSSLQVCCTVHMTMPSVSCSTSCWGIDLTQACKCNNLAVCLWEVASFAECCTLEIWVATLLCYVWFSVSNTHTGWWT